MYLRVTWMVTCIAAMAIKVLLSIEISSWRYKRTPFGFWTRARTFIQRGRQHMASLPEASLPEMDPRLSGCTLTEQTADYGAVNSPPPYNATPVLPALTLDVPQTTSHQGSCRHSLCYEVRSHTGGCEGQALAIGCDGRTSYSSRC